MAALVALACAAAGRTAQGAAASAMLRMRTTRRDASMISPSLRRAAASGMPVDNPGVNADFLRALPKVEIHCHLLGTVRQATFADLARKAGAPVSLEEVDAFYVRGEKPVGVLRALRTLDQIIRRPDDLYRMTREYLEDAASHTVRYAELFWNPTSTARGSRIPYAQAQEAIVRA